MSTERLFLVDPYNQKHIEMISEFEINNELKNKISNYLKTLNTSVSKNTYLKERNKGNDFEESLFVERNGKISDYCYIHGEKDIKTCKIKMYPLKNKNMKRRLPSIVADFALNTLGFEEVFIDVDENDNNMIEYLETHGFECLGIEDNKIIYLKEREQKDFTQRTIL